MSLCAPRAIGVMLLACIVGLAVPANAQGTREAGGRTAMVAQAVAVGPFPFGTRYDPRLAFRTISVGRFDIHYHEGTEPLARRLAGFVEEVADQVDARLGAPRGRVSVILVDQTDVSNGWATILPYNLIELAAVPPAAQSQIGNTNDWLRLVFAHEYVHIAHLEKSGGWLGPLRRVFGRLPIFYPNLTLPTWQIEGIATYEESVVTGRGRIPASDFRMLLEHAAAEGRFEPLDRASQPLVSWPSGTVPYLYGGYFHEYLVEQYGPDSLVRLADATAARLPYAGAPAFRAVYGRPLGELWSEFASHVAARTPRDGNAPGRERMTQHGYRVSAPVIAGDGRLFYSVANPRGFPAILEWQPDGAAPRHVTTRFGGSRLTIAGGELVFDQLEFVRSIDLQSDLYAVPMDGGSARRLTREARAADPDVSPDGRTIACTVQRADRRALAIMQYPAPGETGVPEPIVSEAGVEFAAPRWSPDGRSLVAERRTLHGASEIVIVNIASREVRPVVSTFRSRNVTPAWSPDGHSVVFAADRGDDGFTLHEVDVATGAVWRLEAAGPGTEAPAFPPDGSALVFVGYSVEGFDLFKIPADGTDRTLSASEVSDAAPGGRGLDPEPAGVDLPGASRSYRPWATLTPRFWTPIVAGEGSDLSLGAATGGYDALGRHAWFGTAAWALEHGRPEWRMDYAYARWRPTLFAGLGADVETWRAGEVRSVEADAGVLVPVRRVRWGATAMGGFHLARDTFGCSACAPAVDARFTRSALRAGWSISNARGFGYSVSPEEGGAVTIVSEFARRTLGADADAGAAVAEAQGYFRAIPRRGVLAARVAGATAWGETPLRRVFSAAGSGPQGPGFGVGSGAIGLVRGVREGAAVGHHAVVANLDYRFPVAWVERGLGTLPVMLRQFHGAIFADAGAAWDDRLHRDRVARAFGAELSADVVFGYGWPLTLAAGMSWRDEGQPGSGGWAAFTRIGRAF